MRHDALPASVSITGACPEVDRLVFPCRKKYLPVPQSPALASALELVSGPVGALVAETPEQPPEQPPGPVGASWGVVAAEVPM